MCIVFHIMYVYIKSFHANMSCTKIYTNTYLISDTWYEM